MACLKLCLQHDAANVSSMSFRRELYYFNLSCAHYTTSCATHCSLQMKFSGVWTRASVPLALKNVTASKVYLHVAALVFVIPILISPVYTEVRPTELNFALCSRCCSTRSAV